VVVIVSIIAIAVTRIVATYHVFSNTFDEGAHVAAGMEVLERGTYTFDQEHAPLARLATATLPYLAGLRLHGATNMWDGGFEVLYANGSYSRNLALARAGILPFFVLAALVVFAWGRQLFDDGVAIVALVLFTTTPAVLAHASVATTDMAVTAGLASALYVWTGAPTSSTVTRALLLGVALGLAILTKLTSLMFFPACAAATVICRRFVVRHGAADGGPTWALRALTIAAVTAGVAVWAGYRFSFGPPMTRLAGGAPVPAPELVNGLQQIVQHNSSGHDSYLLGEFRRTGWWYFFPVALAVKTPIALLCLCVAGATATVRRAAGGADWRVLVPLVCAATILIVVMPANINIGLRHILPIYPFLALLGAVGAAALWRAARTPWAGRTAAAGLIAWQFATSAAAHPDYLAYFNVAAGPHPERVLLDSDLDWGQDLLRLADTVRARRIPALRIAYFGTADVTKHGMPNVTRLGPNDRPTGWIAASQRALSHPAPRYVVYHWLNAYTPVARAGKSIVLFYIPPRE